MTTATTTLDDLDRRQVEALRAAMLERARQLREEIRQTLLKSDSEQYLQIAHDVRDLEDESFADLIVDVSLAEIDRDLEELRVIDAALLRVADGSYGTCSVCDRPIEVRRLEATPHAARCIDCQTVYERTHFSRTGSTL
ncbi:MAG TPA: TraR/DksA family transcriptional regulator [Steroidobacteraceae bacterium]|nr:TraR/DksA family transcriptional regulator [Steroidobacteraceae bacterium]